MSRQLSAAIIAIFRDFDRAHHRQQLQRFSARQWQKNFSWLDATGLALYLLDRLRLLDLDDAVPDSILLQLERRRTDNRLRTAFLFEEFTRLNAAFRAARLEYVNLKGFTLIPGYCPDMSLRCQMDFDFLIPAARAEECEGMLRTLGYSLMASNAHVMEFKSQAEHVPHVRDLYKARPQHAVEVHLCDDSRLELQAGLLERSVNLFLEGRNYPALAPEDMFLCQASHIFRHIRGEWTRLSWLLEFRHFILSHREDVHFWSRVRKTSAGAPDAALAVGVALRLAEKVFGGFAPPDLREWTVETLPRSVALWIERYGDEIMLAEFPGSKLYLILERELDHSPEALRTIRRRLLPVRGPARVTAARSTSPTKRFAAYRFQLRYFLFRLRFHLAQTPRCLLENWRWRRISSLCRNSDSANARETPAALSRETAPATHSSYRSLTVKQQ